MVHLTYSLLIVCVSLSYDTISAQRRISGGHAVSLKDHPYIAHLTTDITDCGGTILDHQYILTAAHCVERVNKIKIRIGSLFIDTGGLTYTSDEYWIYGKNWRFDVAVVKASVRMNLEGVDAKPVSLIGNGLAINPGTKMTIIGWGLIDEHHLPSYLLGTEVFSNSNSQCRRLFREDISPLCFCAGTESGSKGPCNGDSGGPAMANGIQIGIISYLTIRRCGAPTAYVNITYPPIRQWIEKLTGI